MRRFTATDSDGKPVILYAEVEKVELVCADLTKFLVPTMIEVRAEGGLPVQKLDGDKFLIIGIDSSREVACPELAAWGDSDEFRTTVESALPRDGLWSWDGTPV